MSEVFFQQLAMPEPDVNLGVGSGSHAQQTAQIMSRIEPVLVENRPDLVVVYGDVNSTLAAALVCSKLLIRVAHVEAGLRSFDRTMPEEINRVITDHIADILFTPSHDGDLNLQREGVGVEKIFRVGNVLIDSLVRLLPAALACPTNGFPERYALVTLHRPANVDDSATLRDVFDALVAVQHDIAIVFPVHPRTRQRIKDFALDTTNVHLVEPLPYIEFLALQKRATLVVTDSGGIQEETTYLGIPCLTVRENTERPVTVSLGTNTIVGRDPKQIISAISEILEGRGKKGSIPALWDGHTAERIAAVLNPDLAPEKCAT
jgi:UDP-N-acetylglucosamine 2-epimerase (non-hydrolysing)